MRLSFDELNKVKEKFGVDTLWSFSRFDTYRTSKYVYFLRYILHMNEDDTTSAYAPLGGAVHDLIQGLYEGKYDMESLPDEFEDDWMMNIDIQNLKFDKSDETKNASISRKYYDDLTHFVTHYKMLPYKMHNEEFIPIKIADDIVFQGYIDAYYLDNNKNVCIVDYKTSTKYSGSAIDDHAAQLLLYAEGMRQKGVPADRIKVCWNFLKYVSVDYQQANGKIANTTIERYQIGEKLQSKAKTWLNKLGYKDDADQYLAWMIEDNGIDRLPDEVKEKFSINDCYVYVDDIFEKYEKLKAEIIETVKVINEKTAQYQNTQDDKLFWDDEDDLKKQSYYYSNLCGYSINKIKPYAQWLEKQKEGTDIFGGNPLEKKLTRSENEIKEDKKVKEEDDMSWLDALFA